MSHLDEQHGDARRVVSELATLGQHVFELQTQLAALVPQVVDDPRARQSLARSRRTVTDLHLRAWAAGPSTSSSPAWDRHDLAGPGHAHHDEGRR